MTTQKRNRRTTVRARRDRVACHRVAQLMIAVGGTTLTVALPSIQNGLQLVRSGLNWILRSTP